MFSLEHEQKDYLTGFYHREALKPFLRELLLDSKAKKKNFSMALIDMDHFKQYNDKYGHSFGDLILKYLSGTLRMSVEQDNCFIFRYGGDEFIAIFPDKGPAEAINSLKKCSHNLTTRPFLFENKFYTVTISSGIATFPYDGREVWELFEKADEALYFSKRHGHNRSTYAGSIRRIKTKKGFVILLLATAVISGTSVAYYSFVRPYIPHIMVLIEQKVRGVRKAHDAAMVAVPKDLDMLVLKDGSILEGYILEETGTAVVFNLYMSEGEGSLTLDKTEIKEIRYRSHLPTEETPQPE